MHTVRLGRVLLVAAVSALVPLAGNVVATVLTDWSGRAGWLVVPAVGVIVAMITALIEAYGSGGTDSSQEPGRTPLMAALVISVVVLGAGGVGVAAGTRALVITEADLPEGYIEVRSERFSSVSRCGRITGFPTATRALRKKLSELGLERCELTQYEKRLGDKPSSAFNRPTSQAFVMRDEQAASELLPKLRRLFLATIDPNGAVASTPHSLPVSDLGDETLRGVTVIFEHPSFPQKMTQWVYLWRRGDIVAWVGSSDTAGDFDQLSTLDLARAIDARLRTDDRAVW